ncbi:PREDICTED: probable BOI-related E3 ubiquitin-protein ligase 2 [Camelina sativa]|uniref:Probable BOI-related E3 ubiquitin-protein ligase 2 n=1 Tax=Camelina sativa TaxID=90675 RepID=A0ABM0WLE2_CAMSA|nr:PREDICTED: probable BOI-related E3 ubiquitin-protein ligase 2 [Camelina sativa]
MAVDAHNLFLSPPQLFPNREFMMNNNTTMEPTSGGFCNNNQTGYGVVSPFSVTDDTTTTPTPPSFLHMYGSGGADTTTPTTAGYYAADGTTTATTTSLDCDFFPLQTRKRSRESSSTRSNYYHNHHHLLLQNQRSSSCVNAATSTTPFSFLGQDIDISSHMNQQQHDIDRFVSLHMERVKYEIEEKRKRQARMIIEAIEQGLAKRLRVKEEERERIVKVNYALEERVKSLSIENQIWRDLAQTNEATANHLRTNLDQVLAQVNDLRCAGGSDADNNNNEEDDAQSSCCGSTKAAEGRKLCRNCGEEESCVLLLPCRHLCLCGVCGSSVHTCPICTSPKNASVHVNMSSS